MCTKHIYEGKKYLRYLHSQKHILKGGKMIITVTLACIHRRKIRIKTCIGTLSRRRPTKRRVARRPACIGSRGRRRFVLFSFFKEHDSLTRGGTSNAFPRCNAVACRELRAGEDSLCNLKTESRCTRWKIDEQAVGGVKTRKCIREQTKTKVGFQFYF